MNGPDQPVLAFPCEHCRCTLVARRADRGTTIRCPHCGTPTAIPQVIDVQWLRAHGVSVKTSLSKTQKVEVAFLVAIVVAGVATVFVLTLAPHSRNAVARSPRPAQSVNQGPVSAPEKAVHYELSSRPTLLEGGRVRIDVSTNIPGTIDVMAAVSLAGQKPGDVYIGTDSRLRISNGTGSATLSVSDLPMGAYDVEVSFYPSWGFQDSTSRGTGIRHEIHTTARVKLTGSGESAATTVLRTEGQRWVMVNLGMGIPWRESQLVGRFGKYEEVQVQGLNPHIIKGYYFPAIDMTIFANVLKAEVAFWRVGRTNR